jgi:hypothetical protein
MSAAFRCTANTSQPISVSRTLMARAETSEVITSPAMRIMARTGVARRRLSAPLSRRETRTITRLESVDPVRPRTIMRGR